MEGWREIGFDAQTARFVRVYGDKLVDKGRDGYLMQIGEVEAYGTPAVDSDAANAALEALEAARAKITGEDTTALDAAIKALKDAIADENSTQSEINALIKAADAELAKFTVSTAEAAAALAEAKNAVSDGSLRLVSEKTMNALQDAIDAKILSEGKFILNTQKILQIVRSFPAGSPWIMTVPIRIIMRAKTIRWTNIVSISSKRSRKR